ncbi:MAG: adenosine deaminase [Gemmatimonadaceae bacterium]|nr:adenosine deaminase [Gemmatimonadaceae bacterium]NUR21233.1 adenosine deaminase [Gemmatimonadaceae bacterium]NUS96375.1 adenosine deaminase [Gemmatimonadaceae bacterium]
MPRLDRDLLRRLPKAELHCHLDGSVRPATLLDLAREQGVSMPAATPEALREFMIVRDAHNLEEYLARFDITLSVMQTEASLERTAYELAEDAAAEGVRYIEVRYAPVLNVRGGLSLGAAVEAPLRGLARAERDHAIVGRVIICGLRNMSPEVSLELSRLAVAYRDRGVVGFDLAGGEMGNPASVHAKAFEHARCNDLACTCHAGEGAGADSVRQAVHVCCANRLGHATRLIEDESLTEYVNDRRIALEICLTSNVQTRATDSYETHPLRQYYERGLNVVLNTDNRLMSGVTLVDEYEHATRLGFEFDDLARMALNGFESAFLPFEERAVLVERARAEIAALRAAP